jgi:hypothetical protein
MMKRLIAIALLIPMLLSAKDKLISLSCDTIWFSNASYVQLLVDKIKIIESVGGKTDMKIRVWQALPQGSGMKYAMLGNRIVAFTVGTKNKVTMHNSTIRILFLDFTTNSCNYVTTNDSILKPSMTVLKKRVEKLLKKGKK